jgi:hypothetical protein
MHVGQAQGNPTACRILLALTQKDMHCIQALLRSTRTRGLAQSGEHNTATQARAFKKPVDTLQSAGSKLATE